ncbi:hypothetical protein ACGF5C_33415 [Micromonospora sp. NPDC047620]|uniref:hypothetical protein n=1 Tax=Micromonospora sp. NPDC047620 TaxID=3364251 RepID=UPI00371E4A92
MKSRRWLLAALSGAALVLLPGTPYQVAAPTAVAQAAALAEDDSGAGQAGGEPGQRPGGAEE